MGEATIIGDQPTAVPLPNSEQFYLDSMQGETYLIQISWPLHWQGDNTPDQGSFPIIYIVDGNSLFLTATENAWRRAAASHFAGGGIIVAIGYPLNAKLYDMRRRTLDFSPPTETAIPGHGGADLFLDFIQNSVRPAVKSRFPWLLVSREGFYGHSYGGLLALHALFTRPTLFDCYMASSPSIWWNDRFILKEANAFLKKEIVSGDKLPSLMVFWGSIEQHPRRWNNETEEKYESRKRIAADFRMTDNALDLCKMLRGCKQLHTVFAKEFDGEEHTSMMPCSTNRSLTMFFEDWPLC
ncbi:esterase [Penicillium sp. IBT 31633x]|nr:esterase [Penicillium sp. IBT 31633x]